MDLVIDVARELNGKPILGVYHGAGEAESFVIGGILK